MTKPAKATKQSVSFLPHVMVISHLHRNDYTEDELERTWLRRQEFHHIRAEVHREIRILESSSDANDEVVSRGLEHRTRNGIATRESIKSTAREAVATEQCIQWTQGIHDPERIAQRYKAASERSAHIAHLIALRDEEFVLKQQQQLPQQNSWVTTIEQSPHFGSFMGTSIHLASTGLIQGSSNHGTVPGLVAAA